MEEGPITRSYVRDVRVMVYDGKMHPVDSNDISFKIAGMMAFKEAFMKSEPQLLEPIYDLEIMLPEDVMGEVMGDLQTRRSLIMGMDTKENFQIIKARTPLAELDRYSTTLRSLSQGRANFTQHFAEFATVPYDLQSKLEKQAHEVALVWSEFQNPKSFDFGFIISFLKLKIQDSSTINTLRETCRRKKIQKNFPAKIKAFNC